MSPFIHEKKVCFTTVAKSSNKWRIFLKIGLNTTLKLRRCLLLPQLHDHGPLSWGPLSETDLHLQNSVLLLFFIQSDLNRIQQKSVPLVNATWEQSSGDSGWLSRFKDIPSIFFFFTFWPFSQLQHHALLSQLNNIVYHTEQNAQCPFKVLLELQSHTLECECWMKMYQLGEQKRVQHRQISVI